MNEKDIIEKIKYIILDNADMEEQDKPANIEGLSLTEDLEYDSLSFMNMIVELETEFGISFDDSELLLDNLDDCDKLVKYVVELVSTASTKEEVCV